MRLTPFRCLPVAVFLARKPLNTLGLEPLSLLDWDHLPSAWGVGLSMTKLTSINGLITISPEGGS